MCGDGTEHKVIVRPSCSVPPCGSVTPCRVDGVLGLRVEVGLPVRRVVVELLQVQEVLVDRARLVEPQLRPAEGVQQVARHVIHGMREGCLAGGWAQAYLTTLACDMSSDI